jgi:transposase
MYLRRIERKNKNGSTTAYLQLAHNEWDSIGKCARAKVVYSFGREDQVDRAALERLALSITRMLPAEATMRVQAQSAHQGQPELSFLGSREYGGTWLLEGLWKQLHMPAILHEVLGSKANPNRMEREIFAMVANRALSPASKLSMEEWVSRDVEITGLTEATSQQLYRAMDALLEVRDEVEKQVYHSVADLMNLTVDLLYFDTTSSYFEVEPSESTDGFRKLGYSKDSRPDLLQVVIGLAVTKEGIPIRSWVWPGNTADMSVVEEVKRDLIGWKLGRVIQVMDRGFVSEENLKTLQRAGGHYIAGEKLRSGKADTEAALKRGGRYKSIEENLRIKEIVVGDGERRKRYILCHNPREAERDRLKRAEVVMSLEEELKSLRQLPGERHSKAVCRLRTHLAYEKFLKQNQDGTLVIDREAIQWEARYDGKYLLRTSDDTLTGEDIALGYKQLADVEDAFRTLKTHLELRPMYHRLEDRIRAHILLCWLALLLVRMVEVRTGERWRTVRTEMSRMHVGDFKTPDGHFRQITLPSAKQREWLTKLGLKPPPKLLNVVPLTTQS